MNDISELLNLIRKLLPLLEQFLYVLDEEKRALIELNADQLTEVTERKNRLLDELMPLSEQLTSALPDNTSLREQLRPHLRNEQQRQLLEQFIRLSEKAERQHLENGTTLVRLAQINEGLLNILLGRQENPTYEDRLKGRRSSSSAGGSTLGKA